jgi:hypothetical protein
MNMNPLILFDYVFYRTSNFFGNIPGYKYSKELNGITMLSFLQNLNLFTLLNLFDIRIQNDKQYVMSFFLGLVVLFGFNYIRYIKSNKYKNLNNIWNTECGLKKNIRSTLVTIYFLASTMLMIII